jgi:hypothetical protein
MAYPKCIQAPPDWWRISNLPRHMHIILSELAYSLLSLRYLSKGNSLLERTQERWIPNLIGVKRVVDLCAATALVAGVRFLSLVSGFSILFDSPLNLWLFVSIVILNQSPFLFKMKLTFDWLTISWPCGFYPTAIETVSELARQRLLSNVGSVRKNQIHLDLSDMNWGWGNDPICVKSIMEVQLIQIILVDHSQSVLKWISHCIPCGLTVFIIENCMLVSSVQSGIWPVLHICIDDEIVFPNHGMLLTWFLHYYLSECCIELDPSELSFWFGSSSWFSQCPSLLDTWFLF